MAFQADQKIKSQILNAVGTDQLFALLSDPDINVLMKTLGLLRNLLSNKPVSNRDINFSFTHFLSDNQRSLDCSYTVLISMDLALRLWS